jgi:hypothetical protein
MKTIADLIRDIVIATLPEGEIKVKFRARPKVKPPRRKSPVQNESSKPEYMRDYMKERRQDGDDYQKKPDKIKELRKEQKKKIKEKFDLKT